MSGGVYIHIPLCKSKCSYCSFYSLPCTENLIKDITDATIASIKEYKYLADKHFDTLYIGGGTPTTLGGENLSKIITTAKDVFGDFAEITTEANPKTVTDEDFKLLANAGVNRLSMGLQSVDADELKLLGRIHTPKDFADTVADARNNGINNISGDLIMSIGENSVQNALDTAKFLADLDLNHISAYILKLEEGTPLYNHHTLPNDDIVEETFLSVSNYLAKRGYKHYEISNFAKENYQSRHNTKYWELEEYLGIGPGAHSYINGNRFYFPSDISAYISGQLAPVPDGKGGDFEEILMLGLRLAKGLSIDYLMETDEKKTKSILKKAKILEQNGFISLENSRISIPTDKFLIFNTIFSHLFS